MATWENNFAKSNKRGAAPLWERMKKKLSILGCLLAAGLCALAQGSLEKGLSADAKGLNELAEKYYREAVDTNAQARLRLGLLLERKEHFKEASQWLAKSDSSTLAMTHLAVCLAEQYRWPEARRAAEIAIESAGSHDSLLRASAMATLALTYCTDENYTNALSWAHKAQREDPKSARAHNVVGIISFYKGNENEAIQSFKKALQVDPKNIDAYFNLGTVYCYRNRYELAISTLKNGLKVERNSIKLIYCLGWAYLLKGEKEHAIECLETVIRYDSSYVNAYNRLGDIHYGNADYNQAIACYRKASQIAPTLSEPYRLMGRTYAEKGEFGKALRNYQKAVEINKKDAETYCKIAELYAKQKQPKREQANYKRAAKLGHAEAQKWCTQRGIAY